MSLKTIGNFDSVSSQEYLPPSARRMYALPKYSAKFEKYYLRSGAFVGVTVPCLIDFYEEENLHYNLDNIISVTLPSRVVLEWIDDEHSVAVIVGTGEEHNVFWI